jgi:alpha-galactosidase
MVPGLWLEPEVVGVRSPVAQQLPPEAFFMRSGERVVEQGRYHLDLCHPAAVKHLDEVVDFLVGDLGVGYFKFDYNINVAPGTEQGNVSAGVGMLAHNRALLDWLDEVLDRHPGLTIESCASGGMRTDYALLSRCQLHSTSDQQDFLRYPAIAAAAPIAVAPEQAAVWAYPQPGWSDDEIAFTLCGALLGRVHLSGHIDRMNPAQQQLVADAISVYKRIRRDLAGAVPFWPLGLPGWTDPWVALGMLVPSATYAYVVVWRRGRVGDGPGADERVDLAEIVLPMAHLRHRQGIPKLLYPVAGAAGTEWNAARGELTATLPRTPSACLIQLELTPGPERAVGPD